MCHRKKSWENYSILPAFYDLIVAYSQTELNSGRHFLFTITKMYFDMQQMTCHSRVSQ